MKKILLITTGLLLFMIQLSIAQTAIRGRVTETDGDGISGASIRVKGKNRGAMADNSGSFSILAADGDILIVSSVGYKTSEVAAADGMVIKLPKTTGSLGEVIVTAQGIKKEKAAVGYATTLVRGDDLTKGQDRSVLTALQGKVAGVNITNTSGNPGGGSRVVIRGGSSITGNNQALIVIDNVMYDNSNTQTGGDNLNKQLDAGNRANDINPEDVESMTVLKGPAATVLYGARAANGAIIITTKSGKGGGKSRPVTYSTNYGMSDILMLPEFQNSWGQGYGSETHTEENWSYGPKFDGLLRPWGNVVDGKQQIKPFVAQPNNVKDFFQRGKTWENNVSFGGSNVASSYYISLNNLSNSGVVEGSKYNRNGIRFNGSSKLSEKLSASVGLNYTKINSNLFNGGQANNSFIDQIYQTPRDIPIRELRNLANPFNTVEGYYGAYTINPYYIIQNYKNNNNVDRITGNMEFRYKLMPWLDLVNTTTNDNYTDALISYAPKYTVHRPDFLSEDVKELGSYGITTRIFNEINNDIKLMAKHQINEDLGLSVLLGQNTRQTKSTFNNVETRGGIVANGWENLSNTADGYTGSSSKSLRRALGIYTDIGFNYKSYLYANITGRNDWSSTLPSNKNSYFYPSLSTSFIFSELTKNNATVSKYLSYGKVRASWARVGNDANPYLLTPSFNQMSISDGFNNSELVFPLNGVAATTTSNTLPNPNIKPEIMTAQEIGAEVNFLKNRLGFDLSLYNNVGTNQILPVDFPASSGYTTGILNAGKIKNSGIELLVRGTPIQKKNGLSIEFFATYTKNKSMVVSLYDTIKQLSLGGLNGTTVVAAVGHPYGEIFARGMERSPSGQIVVGANGMPILSADNKLFGSYNPDWMGSFGSDIGYKGFKLHFLFYRKQGGVFYSRMKNLMEFCGSASSTGYNDRADFVVPNSVQETAPGSGTYVANTTKIDAQTFWTEQSNTELDILSATFTKLRELSLTYSVPKALTNKINVGSATVGLYGNNLMLWLPKTKNIFGQKINTFTDPEINGFGTGNTQGLEFGTMPSLKNYGITLRVSF
jgi:TonB-linked SusC/RagA family outer membrane protein